jgi:hypothetical protein
MTVITETARIAVSPVITLKGAGKAKRELAFMQVAPLAMIDTLGRADMIANLRIALGSNPTEGELKTAQVETTIGRVAARLPVAELPKGCTDDSARLEFARDLVLFYAAPAQEGKAARKLRSGQKGRRSVTQHKVIRAADEAWSQIKAELGAGTAKTQSEKNAGRVTRAPSMAGSGKGASKDATPTHAELVKPGKPLTADDAVAYVTTQGATLLAFANKNAKLLPAPFGAAIQAFKSAINAAANEYEVTKAAQAKGAK